MKAKNFLFIILGIGILFLLGYGLDILSAKNRTSNTAQTSDPRTVEVVSANVAPVDSEDQILGDKNASVTLIEYSDFQCPYCITHYPTMKKIIDTYPGKVRWVFRHFPLSFHQAAEKASEAAEAAGAQGKFWQYSDLLVKNSHADGAGLAEADLIQYAKNLGLDMTKFQSDLNSGKFAAKVKKDQSSGTEAKVTGTPATFLVDKNGKAEFLSGALSFEQFKAKIDNMLAE